MTTDERHQLLTTATRAMDDYMTALSEVKPRESSGHAEVDAAMAKAADLSVQCWTAIATARNSALDALQAEIDAERARQEAVRARFALVERSKSQEGSYTWVAYCPVCGKVLEECPNGSLVDAAAKAHTAETEHETYVGYRLQMPADARIDAEVAEYERRMHEEMSSTVAASGTEED